MNSEEKNSELNVNDEINLYDYWKIILKRKKLILSIFLGWMICTILVLFLIPNSYLVEIVIEVQIAKQKESINFLKKLDSETKKAIFPQTASFVKRLKINDIKGDDAKLSLSIEFLNYDMIDKIISELMSYTNSLAKDDLLKEKERLIKEMEEKNNIIKDWSVLQTKFRKLMLNEKTSMMLFNPIDLEIKLINLKVDVFMIENTIKKLESGLKIIWKYAPKKPVSPPRIQMAIISMMLGLFIGIFFAIFLERSVYHS